MSREDYEDITKVCVDCEAEFVVTAGEQDFFASKDLSLPKRCKDCRAAKKARNAQQGGGERAHIHSEDGDRDGYGRY